MDGPFPILEYLSLSSTVDETTSLILPETFLAPNLRHLTLLGIGLPKELTFLSAVSLATLALKNIPVSGYFLPGSLVKSLRSLPQLEELSICFSTPIPCPGAERELLGNRETLVMTFPNLERLTFQGVSAYLECLIAHIRAPLLGQLSITLFDQDAFSSPHLSHFVNITERLKPRTTEVKFERDAVSVTTDHRNTRQYIGRFIRVVCDQSDRRIDCMPRICSELMPALSGTEILRLDCYESMMPTEWQNVGPTAQHGTDFSGRSDG